MPHKHFEIKKIEILPEGEAQITGEITLLFLVELRKEAIKNINNSISLPGFRSGHIPEDILIKNIGEMRVLEETAELALGREYPNIVKESKLSVIGRPEIVIKKLAPAIPLEFSIKVIRAPEFTLPDFKKIVSEIKEEDKEKKRMKIIEALVKESKLLIPKRLIDGEVNHAIFHFRQDVEKAGIQWPEYLEKIKKTEDDLKKDWYGNIETRLKAEFVLAKIAEKENLKTYQEVFEFLES